MIDVIEPELHAAAFAAGRECSTRRGLRNTNSPEGGHGRYALALPD